MLLSGISFASFLVLYRCAVGRVAADCPAGEQTDGAGSDFINLMQLSRPNPILRDGKKEDTTNSWLAKKKLQETPTHLGIDIAAGTGKEAPPPRPPPLAPAEDIVKAGKTEEFWIKKLQQAPTPLDAARVNLAVERRKYKQSKAEPPLRPPAPAENSERSWVAELNRTVEEQHDKQESLIKQLAETPLGISKETPIASNKTELPPPPPPLSPPDEMILSKWARTNLSERKRSIPGELATRADPWLDKYKGSVMSGDMPWDQVAAKVSEGLDIDDKPSRLYNWGGPVGMKWDDWWDGMMKTYPPSKNGYETLNFGLVTDKFHACAAEVPGGDPGHSMPFNHTSGSNMYATLASKSPTSLEGAKVLEISSGRGGGSALLSDCFCPSKMVGLDFSYEHTVYAQARYARDGDKCPIEFVQGDAMALPFEDASFDVIINVQASHAYPSYRKFIKEVHRVLRPGGSFLTSDFRMKPVSDTDALILTNVFHRPVRSIDVKDEVIKSFAENRLIQPFMDACHGDFAINQLEQLTTKMLGAAEPFAPLFGKVKKAGEANEEQDEGDDVEPMLPSKFSRAEFLKHDERSDQDDADDDADDDAEGASLLQNADVWNPLSGFHAAAKSLSRSHGWKEKYWKRKPEEKPRESGFSEAPESEEPEEKPWHPLSKVQGVPTPLSCMTQSGATIETGLRKGTVDFRFYITQK